MNEYHLTGIASALFVVLSLGGLWLQVKLIRARKKMFARGRLADERPTTTLSTNRFFASYIGYYALMTYGLCFAELNHYLVWPRTIAVAIILMILYEIAIDRRTPAPIATFIGGVVMLIFASTIRLFNDILGGGVLAYSTLITQALVIGGTIFLAQGAFHQIIKIRRTGRTGGLSLPMHTLFLIKDVFSIMFGLALGLKAGWPLMVFNGMSLIVQCISIWHFRWVTISPTAKQRRKITPAD